ncbi:hypothetical protein HRbin40_00658 [bacterium HR40]|nr:hypothetical protein HRbin40_00658 [bacterium HR40]
MQLPIGGGEIAVYARDAVIGDGEGGVANRPHLADEVTEEEAFEMTAGENWATDQVQPGGVRPGLDPAAGESRADHLAARARCP